MPQPPAPKRPSTRRTFSKTAALRFFSALALVVLAAGYAYSFTIWDERTPWIAPVVDPNADWIYWVAVTGVDANNVATSLVSQIAPRPWDAAFGDLKGPILVRSDYGRIYILMDGEYHVRGLLPPTMAVVDNFTSAIHGDGVDFDLDTAETTLYSTTTTGEILSTDLAPGPTFGDIGVVATGLNDPRGIAIDNADMYAFVAEHGLSRIARVELGNGMVTTVATLPSPPRDVAGFFDIMNLLAAVLDNGDLVTVDVDPNSPGYGTITPASSGLNNPQNIFPTWDSSSFFAAVVAEAGTGKLLAIDIDPNSPDFGVSMTLASGLGTPGGVGLILIPGFVMLPCASAPATGSSIAACLYAGTGATELGSYGGTLTWDATKLSFAGWGPGDAPFDTPIVNTTNAASGMLAFSDAAASGAAGTTHLLCVDFDVIGARTGTGQTFPLNLTMTSAFDTGLVSLLPTATVVDAPVDIVAACTIGDPVADASIDSGDALAILRHEMVLPIPIPVRNLLQARCGDLNDDGRTDSTDAAVALTYEVGLPVDPNFPLMQSNVVMKDCAGGACAGQLVPPAPPPFVPAGLESAAASPVTARLRVDTGKVLPGRPFDVVVEVDAGARSVGSFAAALTWDAGLAEMTAVAGGKANALGSLTVNDTEAASGKLRFAAASPAGATGVVELARVTMVATRALPRPEEIFTLKFTSMAAPGPRFESLLRDLEIAGPAGTKGRP